MMCSTSYSSQSTYPDGCYTIAADCTINVNIDQGNGQTQAINLQVVNKCARFNVARGAVALSALLALMLIVLYIIKWFKMRQLPLAQQTDSQVFSLTSSLGPLTLVFSVLSFIATVVSFSLLIQEKQDQDAQYDAQNQIIGPGSFTLTYSASFAFIIISSVASLASVLFTLFFIHREKRNVDSLLQPQQHQMPTYQQQQQPMQAYYIPMHQ